MRRIRFCLLSLLLGVPLAVVAPAARADAYLFDGSANPGCTLSGKVYSCGTLSLGATDSLAIASGYTVNVNSALTLGYNNAIVMSGTARLSVGGNLDVSDVNFANMRISGGTLAVNGSFRAGDQNQNIVADITATSMLLGSGATLTITGTLMSSGAVAIASHATLNGAVIGTNITTGTPVTINGKVTATGTFTLASDGTVNGDVDANTLVLQSSEARINGDASVTSATLGWHGVVTDIITCKKGTTAGKCDCVSNGSGYPVGSTDGPTCQSAVTGPDHFQVEHGGTGLTCMPQTVTVKACADASCSTLFTGGATVTLLPGQQQFTIGPTGINSAPSVAQTTAGSATLFAGTGTTCRNTVAGTASCAMMFSDAAFVLAAPDHVAGGTATLSIQAIKKGASGTQCVPAFGGATQNIALRCTSTAPANGATAVTLDGQSCGPAGATLPVSFNQAGGSTGTLALVSDEVGRLQIQADLATPAMSGTVSLVAAPARLTLAAPGPFVAGKASTLSVKALTSGGAVASNFGKEGVVPTLTQTFCAPLGGSNPAASFGAPSVSNGAGGGLVYPAFAWAEVGRLEVDASVAKYLGSAFNASGSTSTSGTGTCTGGGSVGPFVANHIKVESGETGGVAHPYYYAGETVPTRISARNALDAVLQNYDKAYSGYAKAVTLEAVESIMPAPGVLATVGTAAPLSLAATDFSKGVAMVGMTYTFAAAKTAPYSVGIRAQDPDTQANVPVAANRFNPLIRKGRLRMASRYGAARVNLDIPVLAEYWNGASWQLNTDDNYTVIPTGAVALTSNLTYSGMKLVSSTFTLVAGQGALRFQAPTGGSGPASVALNLGMTAGSGDTACLGSHVATTGAKLPYLRSTASSCAVAPPNDPAAMANFGVFAPETRRLIHTREVFN